MLDILALFVFEHRAGSSSTSIWTAPSSRTVSEREQLLWKSMKHQINPESVDRQQLKTQMMAFLMDLKQLADMQGVWTLSTQAQSLLKQWKLKENEEDLVILVDTWRDLIFCGHELTVPVGSRSPDFTLLWRRMRLHV
jgi:hypothetical protein